MDDSQKTFFLSSSFCSCRSSCPRVSIFFTILAKPTFSPRTADSIKLMRSSSLSLKAFAATSRLLLCILVERTCIKLGSSCSVDATCSKLSAGVGNVFLKRSSASSSLSSLIVSDSNTCSADASFSYSFQSRVFTSQAFFRSARNLLSSSNDSLVSLYSFFSVTTLTANSPSRAVLSSMALDAALISRFFALCSASLFPMVVAISFSIF
mmetsp:Transcript_88299/g.175499  ORF Transcript_88299/g.175499 Transcript_88299/m.175499 type:complete len:209 (+) Transcript_88299:908-1534(+)